MSEHDGRHPSQSGDAQRIVTPIETAQEGAARTESAVSLLRAVTAEVQALYVENNYVPRLRAIFRGA